MNSSDYSDAQKIILSALHLDRSLPSQEQIEGMQNRDWERLSEIARIHRLGPILHASIAGFSDAIPESIKTQLQSSQRKNAMRTLKIYHELVSVTRILDKAGIASIALKGAYLARFAYPDPALRSMRDLDLLIKPEQTIEAFELLKKCGYRALSDGLPEAHFSDRKHLPPLMSAAGINIELHHQLTQPKPGSPDSSDFVEKIWARSIKKSIGGTQIGFLCTEDLLLHLSVHATQEHRFNLGPLALSDVAFLLETHKIDWADFLAVAVANKWQRCALPLLCMAKKHLGADVPEETLNALRGGEANSDWLKSTEYLLFSNPEDHKVLDCYVQDILYSESYATKFTTLFSLIFPSRSAMSLQYQIRADSPYAYLYYPLRWCRLLRLKFPILIKSLANKNEKLKHLSAHRNKLDQWLNRN